ncbi:MAG: A24 family peptidase [Methanobacteriota archaeon]|nr:MAG: A24 family peptidase [Euryarchaeota archaeon]
MADTVLLRILSSMLILSYGSLQDIKRREIDSIVWQAMVVLAAFFLVLDVYSEGEPRLLIPFIFIVLVGIVFSAGIHHLGLMGGGDAKLLIGLSAMFPLLPPGGRFIFPALFLSVFTNAILISLLIPLWFFISNIRMLPEVRGYRDLLRLFAARRKEAKDVGRFEAVLDDDRLFISTKNVEFGAGDRDGEVWAAPALPFIVFLTAGFVVSILYGDILYILFA